MVLFRRNEALAIESHSPESQLGRDVVPIPMNDSNRPSSEVSLPRKKVRGPTQTRSVWGLRESEGPLPLDCNEFSQTSDKNGQSMSSFIGSMIRDGKIAPLDYESWHKVPNDVKEKLWSLAQTRYGLHD